MSTREHWEGIYRTKPITEVGWFRPHLDQSLALVDAAAIPKDARIVDVGAGASTLVDDLLARGYTDLTVIDLAKAALEHSRTRLGERAAAVRFIQGDITTPLLEPASVDLWHDRAVFHFLTEPAQRERYVAQVLSAVRPGGHVLIGTFAPDGPERCSGLPVVRYDPEGIARALGPAFTKVAEGRELHETPRGVQQAFAFALCHRTSGAG